MKKTIAVVGVFLLIGWGTTVLAADQMSHEGHKAMGEHGNKKAAGMGMTEDEHKTMGEHGKGEMTHGGTFTHQAVTDGVRADFQVMSLASMNMKDPEGATHHIMVTFHDDSTDAQIKDVTGNIKVIGPDKKDQVGKLKNYSGTYAANFAFGEKGKYGVICLVKASGKKHVYKFWYAHELE